TVSLALAAPRLPATTWVPVAAARRLRGGKHEADAPGWFLRLRDGYERALRAVLGRRGLALAAAALLFAASMALFPFVGSELFPPTDARQFTILMRGPSGLRVDYTEGLMLAVEYEMRSHMP